MFIQEYTNGSFRVRREPGVDSPVTAFDGHGNNLLVDLQASDKTKFLRLKNGILCNKDTLKTYRISKNKQNVYCKNRPVWLHGLNPDQDELKEMVDLGIVSAESVTKWAVSKLNCLFYGEDGWVENDRYKVGEILVRETGDLARDFTQTVRQEFQMHVDMRSNEFEEYSDGVYNFNYKKNGEPILEFRLIKE